MYQIKLDQFSGPLDLLLQLIEGQKLDISSIALAEVTDQYLEYLEKIEDINPAELADFLVVATKLLVIKSKVLLPQMSDDEEDSAEVLEAQLKIYKDYLAAARHIEAIIGQKRFCFTRERIAFQFEPTFSPPPKLKTADLSFFFQEILNRIDYVVNLPQKVMEKSISLREVVHGIRQALMNIKKLNFKEILGEKKSRAEMVICFVALLELIKKGEIAVTQKGLLDEIVVERV